MTASFQLGMMAGQVPVGAFMDRVGTRIGLAAIFIAWSIVGGAHALASGLMGFVALRFLMGLGECGSNKEMLIESPEQPHCPSPELRRFC